MLSKRAKRLLQRFLNGDEVQRVSQDTLWELAQAGFNSGSEGGRGETTIYFPVISRDPGRTLPFRSEQVAWEERAQKALEADDGE